MKPLIAAVIFLLVSSSAEAAFKKTTVRLVLKHEAGLVEAQTLGGKAIDASALAASEPLEVNIGQKVELVVEDPNPLLFQYEWGGVELKDNPNYSTALAFAKRLKDLIGVLPKLPAIPTGGEEAGAFDDTRSTATPFEQFVGAVDRLRKYVNEMPGLAQKTLGGTVGIAQTKSRVEEWELDRIDPVITEFYEKAKSRAFAELLGPTTTDDSPFNPAKPSGSPKPKHSEKELNTAISIEVDVKDLLEKSKKFRTQVRAINNRKTLGTVDYNVQKDAVATVKITPTDTFKKLAEESQRAIGDLRFPIQTRWPADFELGGAAVYSLAEVPEFKAEKQDNGKYKIVKTDTDFSGMTVAAMLSIVPRPWTRTPLGGAVQFGFTPVKDQMGLFAGLQFRVTDLFSIGGGYAYQQVKDLASGLAVDGEIDSPDLLKTKPRYSSGWYLGLEVKVK